MTFTYQEYLFPKSPPPPVKPNPPLAPPTLNVPYGPLTGPPWPNGTMLFASSTGSVPGFRLVALVSGFVFFLAFLSGIGIASGSGCLTSRCGCGCDCDTPLDSLASTFCVCVALAGRGTLLTRVTPMASPPPPAPQSDPRLAGR